MISANVIEDSVSPAGARVVTLELQYHRYFHGELLTHRVLSRNSASSRAIPVRKMLAQVEENPAEPCRWPTNQPGMQGGEELGSSKREEARLVWQRAAGHAAYFAEALMSLGVHKSIPNRLLEPFQWMRTIVTATEWDGFFALRDHSAALPEFQLLAKAMRKAMDASTPSLRTGELDDIFAWHLPYVSLQERIDSQAAKVPAWVLIACSAARCARVSYLTHDGENPSIQKDLDLFMRLVGSEPLHASPIEHQATPLITNYTPSRNFRGWLQFRELFEDSQALRDLYPTLKEAYA